MKLSTLDRHACGHCGRLLTYTPEPPGKSPWACTGADNDGDRCWSYACKCGTIERGFDDPPTLRDVLDADTVAALEADIAAAYERGREDRNREVVDWLETQHDDVLEFGSEYDDLTVCAVLGDAADAILASHHQTTPPNPSSAGSE